jgi:putative DNA primase/helicase
MREISQSEVCGLRALQVVGENQVTDCTGPTAIWQGRAMLERDDAMLAPDDLILDRRTPWNSALAFLELKHSPGGLRTLHHHAGVFYRYTGTHYAEVDSDAMRSIVWPFRDSAECESDKGPLVPFAPTTRSVNELIDALKAAAHLPTSSAAPAWLEDGPHLPAIEFVSCQNGLLHLPSRKLIAHTPSFFTHSALPFSYDPNAPLPIAWLSFLNSVWGDDPDAIGTLQEMFGYFLIWDTRQQKLFLIVGPKRSGKGTIGRVLTALLGRDNVEAPTLVGLGTNFGLAPLIGKPLAIISDARLGGKADQQLIAERLLSISGEDSLTIDRKYKSAWTGRLPTRFLILTNELPRLADASGALASRFITLVMTKTFYGREELGLESRLLAELPSILNWALIGRDRLMQRGYFVPPASSLQVVQELEDLGSPISAFLRDECVVAEGQNVETNTLFDKWRSWCVLHGRDRPGTTQTFGRDLRAAMPGLRVSQPRKEGERQRYYEGVGLRPFNFALRK